MDEAVTKFLKHKVLLSRKCSRILVYTSRFFSVFWTTLSFFQLHTMLKMEMKLTCPAKGSIPLASFKHICCAPLVCSSWLLCIRSAVFPLLSIKSATVSPASSSLSHQHTDSYVPTMIYIVSWSYLLFHLHPLSYSPLDQHLPSTSCIQYFQGNFIFLCSTLLESKV